MKVGESIKGHAQMKNNFCFLQVPVLKERQWKSIFLIFKQFKTVYSHIIITEKLVKKIEHQILINNMTIMIYLKPQPQIITNYRRQKKRGKQGQRKIKMYYSLSSNPGYPCDFPRASAKMFANMTGQILPRSTPNG